MKKTTLTRSTPYWLLLVLSLASTAVGGWLVWDNTTTMQTTILAGTATNVEVYVGQAWITSGSALLSAGIIGILLWLVLSAAKALIPTAPVVIEPIDWTADAPDTATGSVTEAEAEASSESADQNGSSGSIATETNSSVR